MLHGELSLLRQKSFQTRPTGAMLFQLEISRRRVRYKAYLIGHFAPLEHRGCPKIIRPPVGADTPDTRVVPEPGTVDMSQTLEKSRMTLLRRPEHHDQARNDDSNRKSIFENCAPPTAAKTKGKREKE